jgi:hypothetical protein
LKNAPGDRLPGTDAESLLGGHDRDEVLDIVFGVWFPPHDELEELVLLYADAFADREQVRFRFRGRNRNGAMLVEQQAYLAQRDGLIGWMRIVCSGQRPCP